MNLTVRQWLIIGFIAACFIAAAIVVSNGNRRGVDGVSQFDEVVWCESANAISVWRSILDGSTDGDTGDDVANLRETLTKARSVAPSALKVDLARLLDFVMLTDLAFRDLGNLEIAVKEGRSQTDQAQVAEALDRVSAALVACGSDPLGFADSLPEEGVDELGLVELN